MDLVSLGIIVGGVLVPVFSFVYVVIRNIKTDHKIELGKISDKIDKLEKDMAADSALVTQVNMRVDTVEQGQDKLETSVESKLDKFEEKLDKIYDLLIHKK